MKRSLLTVIILALCVLNFILSAVIVFVLVPPTMKTDKLISKVCAVLDLELEAEQAGDKGKVSMDSITSYNIENGQTITLQPNYGTFELGAKKTNYKPWLDKALSLLPINAETLGRSIFTPRNMTELDFNQKQTKQVL